MFQPQWKLLDQAEEDALHLNRLLTVDEKPFSRITKRLLAKDALIRRPTQQLPTPPPDASGDDEIKTSEAQPPNTIDEAEWKRYHDDILFDFASLEATLIRLQFLQNANEREREHYAAEKDRILSTAEAVRANISELRTQLVEAQRTLTMRKKYDELADTILNDKALKSRDVLSAENEKLQNEIDELEQEGKDFDGLWRERRERFNRVVEEGQSLSRYIKGTEEVNGSEETDGLEEGEENDGNNDNKIDRSSTAGTPLPDHGGATPTHTDIEGEGGVQAAQHTIAQRAIAGGPPRPSGGSSRASSPANTSIPEDVDMSEAAVPPLPITLEEKPPSAEIVAADQPGTDTMDTT